MVRRKVFGSWGIARMGIGGGEASVTPASWSLLADYFPPEKRALPVSIFLMGPYLGAGLSLLLGAEVIGWASELGEITIPIVGVIAPWQLTFMLVALPGGGDCTASAAAQRACSTRAADLTKTRR